MKAAIILATVLVSFNVSAAPRQCNPEKSKPCGKSCISKDLKCHKTAAETTAVVAPPKK